MPISCSTDCRSNCVWVWQLHNCQAKSFETERKKKGHLGKAVIFDLERFFSYFALMFIYGIWNTTGAGIQSRYFLFLFSTNLLWLHGIDIVTDSFGLEKPIVCSELGERGKNGQICLLNIVYWLSHEMMAMVWNFVKNISFCTEWHFNWGTTADRKQRKNWSPTSGTMNIKLSINDEQIGIFFCHISGTIGQCYEWKRNI